MICNIVRKLDLFICLIPIVKKGRRMTENKQQIIAMTGISFFSIMTRLYVMSKVPMKVRIRNRASFKLVPLL